MKIIVDNIATLYYDAPSNTSRDEDDDDDDEEEFDQLISGTPTSSKAVKKASRKRDALEGGADSDSSASGPSSTSASAKKAKMGRPQLKTKTEEPSSTHRLVGWSSFC